MGKPEKGAELIAAKAGAVANAVGQGHPRDNVKRVAGADYAAAKQMLSFTQMGHDAPAFARNMLSKLISLAWPSMTSCARAFFVLE